MARYMMVDADQLDEDLTSVAESIRTKGETTTELAFPDGFKSAIDAISTGAEIKQSTGTVRVSSGSGNVSLGFTPDLVILSNNLSNSGYTESAGFGFTASQKTKMAAGIWTSITEFSLMDIQCTQNQNGFSIKATLYDGESSSSYSGNLSYVAVKYTE